MSSNVEQEPGPQAGSSTGEPEKRKREYKNFGHDEEKHAHFETPDAVVVDMSKVRHFE
jgi:hypothetical protein